MKASEYIFGQIQKGQLDSAVGKGLLEEIIPDDIAIVGMSCEYSDIKDTFEFYQTVKNGKQGFKEFPKGRIGYIPEDHTYLHNGAKHLKITPEEFLDRLCKEKGSYLEDIDTFDYDFFGISQDEARYIDPTHRLVMKHSYLALEDAGIRLSDVKDSKTAIYIGKDKSITASYRSEIEEDSNHINSGNWEGILASRLNYIYNLSGGSFVVDTACSSSLVAAHLALKTLRDKEIDTAIVGGIALGLFPRQGSVLDQYSNVETPRSFLKVFDAESQGTIFGEGVGIVILKRLKDAIADNDNIYSIIRGSMINSDGKSNGLTAPNPHAQKDLLLDAYTSSHISPETVDYIDAHGTGTKLGDPIEVRGLTDAYKKYVNKRGFCALTSLKENIGHTVGAAGVGGLIKMSLALRNQEIFPNHSFEAPNEYIKFVDSPFYIPTQAEKWIKGKYPRRGGISSFGFSGTNAHVILEEYEHAINESDNDQCAFPFVFTAQSPDQLIKMLYKYVKHEEYMSAYRLQDISYTLIHRRNWFNTGVGFQASSMEEFLTKVRAAITLLEDRVPAEGIFTTNDHEVTADMKKLIHYQLKTDFRQFDLNGLIQLKLDGYETKFDEYPYQKARTVTLPGYEFKSDILWATVKRYSPPVQSGLSLSVKATLIQEQVIRSAKSDVYQVNLSPDDWFVDDHRIGGKRTFSGTTYTELAAELASLYFDEPAFTLEKLYFKNLIQLNDKTDKRFLIHVNKLSAKQLDIEVLSYENDDLEQYTTHAVFTLKPQEVMEKHKLDLSSEVHNQLKPTAMGSTEEENNFFKGRWNFIAQDFRMVHMNDSKLLLSLNLQEEFLEDLEAYHLHPSMLDGILGAMVYERAQARQKTYLPLSYGRFTYTGVRFTRKMYSVTELLYDITGDHDVITAHIHVYNDQGDLVAYVDKYIMKSFANMLFKPYLHTIGWERSTVEFTNREVEHGADKQVLLISNDRVITPEFSTISRVNYKQLDQITTGIRYDVVIYAPWIGLEITDPGKIEEEMLNYFLFAKTANKLLKRGAKLIFAADQGLALEKDQLQINPLQYAMLSSGRIVGLENTGFTTQMIQISEFNINELLRLAAFSELDGKKVIVDDGIIYEESLIENKDLKHRPVNLVKDDCVIVTGGYGGIGLEYIEQLLDINAEVHIAVLGRTDIQAALASKQERTPYEDSKLNKINKLISKGANLKFYPCDISHESDVQKAITKILAKYNIAGIIHLAGVPEEGMLFSKMEDDFKNIIAPKVTGTLLLRKYVNTDKLQFFVTSSSMTTITGSAGQFSYTVANAYLEGTALSDSLITAIQWPGWKETGMALDFGDLDAADEHLLMKSVSNMEGREYIKLSLQTGDSGFIAGEFNTSKIGEYLGGYIHLPGDYGHERARPNSEGEAEEDRPYQIKDFSSLTVTGTDRQDDVEKFVTVVFASVLDLDEIDVQKSFTDLGGDSLKAFGIYGPIAEQFNIDIEVADVFIYPTIVQLSEYVKELMEEAAA
ncbi:SDR family NAD(P)-dependent oxidoreductase [Paenibacillus sp. Y5S-9]|uniref:SDR family NAD(P)-dependent oxidoreductase n=1 Tax=Paenibacillus sp. Y5S-9 TaxID=3122489 RepID=UPI0030D237FE